MKKFALALALAIAPTLANAAPQLIVNGSFEDIGNTVGLSFGNQGSLSNGEWDTFSSIPGWTLASGPGIEVRHNVSGGTEFGNYYVELDADPAPGDTNIFQEISTAANTIYDLSFAYSPRVGLPDTTNGINVFWNGVQLGGVISATNNTNENIWTIFSFQVTGTGGLDKLSFASVADPDTLGGNIDNVSLTAAVPEPSTYGMMLAGLAMIGYTARRRRS
ncbi:MAG TPA: PEP-CTERM sorting domain-containing protein [Methylophilaceae bacterium]|nr:PEP-CTERM sorting domain-containing protein [Methylophilaceae bacterium]